MSSLRVKYWWAGLFSAVVAVLHPAADAVCSARGWSRGFRSAAILGGVFSTNIIIQSFAAIAGLGLASIIPSGRLPKSWYLLQVGQVREDEKHLDCVAYIYIGYARVYRRVASRNSLTTLGLYIAVYTCGCRIFTLDLAINESKYWSTFCPCPLDIQYVRVWL